MARYRYHDDWRVTYSHDCHFDVGCRSLADALWIAALNGNNSLITVHADCEHEGTKATAHVGIYLKDAKGKPLDEILDLFDRQVDQYIACRVKTSQWGQADI